eukprot:GEMP01012080.1.p1 GENE.GEMP01012080.1~~GEMP01012080.1.p1  ORF type:complete len:512 (+),score=76.79 GEMP01012080.1:32-1567(+)
MSPIVIEIDDKVSCISDVESFKKSPSVSLSPTKGAGVLGATFNLSNAALGAGLLTFPKSFASMGIAFAMFAQVVTSACLYVALLIYGESAKLTSSDSLALITSRLLGQRAGYLAIFLSVSFAWCSCVTYLTIIGTQLEVFGRIVGDVDDGQSVNWYLHQMFTTTIVGTLLVFPLASLRDMKDLSWASFIAVLACWYITMFVVISYFVSDPAPPCDHCLAGYHKEFQHPTFWMVSAAVPPMCFAYQCHLSSIPTYSELTPKTKLRYSYVALGASLVCFFTYSSVGVAGALTFGGCATEKSLILDNFSRDNMPANVGRVFVALAVATSYPIMSFCGRLDLKKVLDAVIIKQGWAFSETNIFLGTENGRLFWVGTIWYISTLIFAIFVPNVMWVVNLSGTSCAPIMFIYPGLIAMKLAYLCNEETIDKTLENLPEGASEDFPDSWAFGVRKRITYWLDARCQRALWWLGVVFVVVGVVMVVICVLVFGKEVADALQSNSVSQESSACPNLVVRN